jgi:hypothetical protein
VDAAVLRLHALPGHLPHDHGLPGPVLASLDGTEAAERTEVVMVSVDPARDTVEQLASYVPYFNTGFTGVTGEFLDLSVSPRR